MPHASSSPVISGVDIISAYAPLRSQGNPRGRLQYLRRQHLISAGARRTVRASKGRVRGSIHLYSELNRDVARFARIGNEEAARNLLVQAELLEERDDFRSLMDALAGATSADQAAMVNVAPHVAIQQLLDSTAAVRAAIETMVEAVDAVRSGFKIMADVTSQISGIVSTVQPMVAVIETLVGSYTVPRSQLVPLHLDYAGAAVEIEWEKLFATESFVQTVMRTLPALAMPDVGVPVTSQTIFSPGPILKVPPATWQRLTKQPEKASELPVLPIPLPRRDT